MTMKEIEVKALEWRESRMGTGSLVAPHPFGENYVVHQTAEGYRSVGRGFHTLDEAKAAAQSDFESRIRSCLLDKPEAVEGDSEIIDALLSNKPFVFDPATHFVHADDGGAPEHGIKYVPAVMSGATVSKFDMTEAQILQWIDACNHEPAKASLRHYLTLRRARAALSTPADTDAAQSGGGSRDALIDQLLKALEAAETYVIDGVTTAKQNLQMNAAYPARKPRYEAELQEARDIYAECQAARRAALAAAKDKP
ncbi:hypothetical protein [Sinorhizobium meliloti]|uniref:hypothetical protein n=1 Tax=Rhizobium meliloti TaxID=382 RepID=UPI0002861505|nr:hypothetical protein [Sinorhizobium meliloti]CCM66756.1 hypothetical protein BN406_00711 [Sinorhizobium meliloti Rm41]